MRINTNISSLLATRQLSNTSKAVARALERLASGKRINRASDDAAGLAISERLRSETSSWARVARGINEAQSTLLTADSALSSQIDLVHRMRELALQAANGLLSVNDRENLEREFQILRAEMTRIAETTSFNNRSLIDGSFGTMLIQSGTRSEDRISLSIDGAREVDIFTNDQTEVSALGTFSDVTSFTPGGVDIASSQLGDLDGDGDLDYVMSDRTNDRLLTYLNDGSGNFSLSQSRATLTNGASIQLADIDGDEVLDVVMGGITGADVISVYRGSGTGTFGAGINIASIGPATNIKAQDIDNDGDVDVVAAESVASISNFIVALNNGDGTFAAATTYLAGTYTFDVEIGDFTNDGILDIISTANNSNFIYVSAGLGNGTFAAATAHAVAGAAPNSNRQIDVGDFDNDGNMDVAVQRTQISDQKVAIYWGTGSGSFSSATTLNIAGNYEMTLMTDDIDGDGVDDLVISNTAGSQFYIRYGGDRGTAFETFASNSTNIVHDAGDVNGDGIVDLAFTSTATGAMSLYLQDASAVELEVELSILTQEKAQNVLSVLSNGLEALIERRAHLGADLNRLDFTLSHAQAMRDNLQLARSRLIDTDVAEEVAELTRLQILQQAQTSALAQSNLSLQIVLSLLSPL